MSLDEDYPKMHRDHAAHLRALLAQDSGLTPEEGQEIAMAINSMADVAWDLNEIFQRLVEEKHTPAEVGELLIAFELTTEQIRGFSDVIDGKLYEIGDRLAGVTATVAPAKPAGPPKKRRAR
jgi:hypothetical protein